MLRAASYALQAVTVVALMCAFVIRARTQTPPRSGGGLIPTVQAGLRPASMQWSDDDWGRGWGGWDMPVHKDESIHKTFSVPKSGDSRAIEVDNIFGSIEVEGGDSDGVEMDVDKTVHAESNQALDRAEKEVTLDVEQDAGSLKIQSKYPSRCGWPECWHFDDHSYAVEMDFKLKVPRDSDLTLKTVDGRQLSVRDVSGTFVLSNVNGGITMEDVSGSGSARTVNGPVKVTFRDNPKNDSQFGSVNGSVELYFAKNLSADFKFRTFSGSVYSDFPVAPAPSTAPAADRHGTMYYYRTSALAGGRVGAGGPMIRVENLNGDIRILEKHE